MRQRSISKLDAARDQLDAAIELFFNSENVIATHTLTAAAYNLLRDIAKKEGSDRPFLKKDWVNGLEEEEKKAAICFLNAPENFFKHADRDTEAFLEEFNPELTEIMLIDATAYFRSHPRANRPKHYDALLAWCGSPKGQISEGSTSFLEIAQAALKSHGKKAFWKLIVEREQRE